MTQSALNGLTSIARKVYDVVPISEPWKLTRIADELYRQGRRVDKNVLLGVLDGLRSDKLIKEPIEQHFIRAPARGRPPKSATMNHFPPATPNATTPNATTPSTTPATPTPVTNPDPLDKLTAIVSAFDDLKHRLEDAILEVQAHLEKINKDSAKAKQLLDLMKSLST